jgi:hypothetical protein
LDRVNACKILGLSEGFSREELQHAFIEKTKNAHKNGDSKDLQLELNVARDVLTEEMNSGTALVPTLTRELVKIVAQQELVSKRQEAKDEFFESLGIAKNRVVTRLYGNRDMAGLFSAFSAGAIFLKNDIAEVTAAFPAVTGGFLVLTSAVFAVFAFMAHRSAKRLEDRTAELNKILTRQRSIERVLSGVFGGLETLEEARFEEGIVQAIEDETGLRHQSQRLNSTSRVLDIYRDFGLLPTRFNRLIGHGFIEDYIDFLIKSEFVATINDSELGLVFTKKKT